MHLLLALCFSLSAVWADSTIMYAPASIPVSKGPSDDATRIFYLARRERVLMVGQDGEFAKIRVKRNGRVMTGYVPVESLRAKLEPLAIPEEGWALGAGPLYSRLSQNGKTFQTQDEVKYTTSTYSSTTVSPFLVAQFMRHDFWRVFVGYRSTSFKGTAHTDVGSSATQVSLEHKMLSLGLQRAWNPFSFLRPFYMGFGAEAARGMSLSLKLDGVEFPTTSQDLPLYLGLHGLTGFEFFFGKTFSLSLESRVGSYLNQSVPVFEVEAGAMGFFWF